MHLAICIWGIVRSLRFTLKSMEQNCLHPITAAGHTYEIFIHTYSFSGAYTNKRSNENSLNLNFTEWKLLHPDHIYVENQDDFDKNINYSSYSTHGDPWNNNYISMKNHIRALNSLYFLANKVEQESKKRMYNGIIYLRPDVTYLNELPVYLLEHIPHTLFLPDFHRSCQGGEYNDRMAMGDLQSGLIYGKRFSSALRYSQYKPLHSEKFTYDHLYTHQVSVKEIPFRFRRTRANGNYHTRDETAIFSPRYQKTDQEYTTTTALRFIYNLLEDITLHKVYIWNHDDHENLYCKPNSYLTLQECIKYRKKSKRRRWELMRLQNENNGFLRTRPYENDEYSDLPVLNIKNNTSSTNSTSIALKMMRDTVRDSIVELAQTVRDMWMDAPTTVT